MKRKLGLVTIILIASCLAGCQSVNENVNNDRTMESNVNGNHKESKSDAEEIDNSKSDEEQENEEEISLPASYSFDCKFDSEEAKLQGILTAKDENGKEIWEYKTEYVYETELECIQDIGLSKNGYLILCNGTIYCIDVTSDKPSVVWENSDFKGASACFDFDAKYNLYIAGYYGPDLMVIDADGKTKKTVEIDDEYAYWPNNLTYMDGKVLIDFDSAEATYSVDPDTGDYEVVYMNGTVVSNVEELVAAIADSSEIILEPGVYNITDWIMEDKENNIPRNDIPLWDYEGENAPGIYIEEVFDGYQLVINGIDNVYMTSKDPKDPAEIVIEPRYAMVINIMNCNKFQSSNLILGHTPDMGSCEGDVIALNNVNDAYIYNCDIYGCGAYAFDITGCESVTVDECQVHDCTYGCAEIFDSYVNYAYSDFYYCSEFTMFEICSSNVEYYGCSFKKLDGNMLYVDEESTASFIDCMFDKQALLSVMENECYTGDEDGQIIIQ